MSDPRLNACRVRVLAISQFENDHRSLARIFSHSAWDLESADDMPSALQLLSRNPPPVVLCDTDLRTGSWQELLRILGQYAEPPFLIVTASAASERLWADVLSMGAYDVLAKPFDFNTVFHGIGSAWRHWMDLRRIPRKASQSVERLPLAVAAAR